MNNGTLTANGSTDAGRPIGAGSRDVSIAVSGTWGGGTITLQYNVNGTWKPIPNEDTYTADFSVVISAGYEVEVRGALTGATSPDLDWTLS